MIREPKDFSVGNRVYHASRHEFGTICAASVEMVEVEFDKPAPSGGPSVGRFDKNWFETHPNWLSIEIAKQAPRS